MTYSSTSPAFDDAAIARVSQAPMFYVVSLRKFTILFLATQGLYLLYWFYKNWDLYKDKWPHASEVGSTVWPVPRAAFSVFFVHALFREVKAHGRDNPAVTAWSNNWHATRLLVLMLLSAVLDQVSSNSAASRTMDIASFAILLPLVVEFRKAQAMINASCKDADGAGNSKFCRANYAWTAAGALAWVLMLAGMVAAA